MNGERKMEKENNEISKQEAATTAREANEFPSPSTTYIKINPEYSTLVNPLTNNEYEV